MRPGQRTRNIKLRELSMEQTGRKNQMHLKLNLWNKAQTLS